MVSQDYSSTSGADLLSSYGKRSHSVMTQQHQALGESMSLNGMVDPSQKRSPLLCGYPSKKCWSWRVEKRNGELHKFCEYHRQKANTNQRRMEQRRKQGRPNARSNATSSSPAAPTTPSNTTPSSTRAAPNLTVNCKPLVLTKTEASLFGSSSIATPTGSPRGVDSFNSAVSTTSLDTPPMFSWMDMDLDIGMDAAVEYMMYDNAIEMEPSDKPVDLYEEDLFFLEHFIDEISRSML